MKILSIVFTIIAVFFTVTTIWGLFDLSQIYNDPVKLADWSVAQLNNAVKTDVFMIVVGFFMTTLGFRWYKSE